MNIYVFKEEYDKMVFVLEVGVDILWGFEDYFEIFFVFLKFGK